MTPRHLFASAAVIAALVVSSHVAQAQKVKVEAKPVGGLHKPAKMDKPEKMEKIDAKDDAKEAAKAARKAEDRAEKAATKSLKDQPKDLLKGVKLTKAQKVQEKAIEKKYADQLKDWKKSEEAAEKSGTPMTDGAGKISALNDQERAELRAVLTPAQQTRFDANASHLTVGH